MALVRFGFRSGREAVVEVEELTITKSTTDNRVTAVRWTAGPGLLFMALDQIDYVLEDRAQ